MLFIAKSHVGNQKKKASMVFLLKETSTKDQQLKSQMMISFKDDDSKKTECVWKENGFFNDQRIDLTIPKPNFAENRLVYVNQGTISVVKGGYAIYLEFVINGKIMPRILILKLTWTNMILRIMKRCCLCLCITQLLVFIEALLKN